MIFFLEKCRDSFSTLDVTILLHPTLPNTVSSVPGSFLLTDIPKTGVSLSTWKRIMRKTVMGSLLLVYNPVLKPEKATSAQDRIWDTWSNRAVVAHM